MIWSVPWNLALFLCTLPVISFPVGIPPLQLSPDSICLKMHLHMHLYCKLGNPIQGRQEWQRHAKQQFSWPRLCWNTPRWNMHWPWFWMTTPPWCRMTTPPPSPQLLNSCNPFTSATTFHHDLRRWLTLIPILRGENWSLKKGSDWLIFSSGSQHSCEPSISLSPSIPAVTA